MEPSFVFSQIKSFLLLGQRHLYLFKAQWNHVIRLSDYAKATSDAANSRNRSATIHGRVRKSRILP